MDDTLIYEELIRLSRGGIPAALATVVESAGSSPRKAGAKMLVRSDGTLLGSVGGGRVEMETVEAALETLKSGAPRTLAFNLTEEYGHVCGGRLLVYIEPTCIQPRLVVIGAGHVGQALATVAVFAGFRVAVADDRPEFTTPDRFPDAVTLFTGSAADAMPHFGIDAASFVVITTTGFEKDFDAVRSALTTPARYIGVIGSRRKREVLVRTLGDEGYGEDAIARLTLPVGLPLGGDTPQEIAVSIVAQLIQLRRSDVAPVLGDTAGRRPVPENGDLQAAPAAP